ncbi:hypothetical protein JT358_16540 [Micrococcales bacterium 31B]|nr:hypothetical protein [Micrococcales bacterium 31B]
MNSGRSDNAERAADLARLAAAAEAEESRKAQVLIDAFVRDVIALGVQPVALRARGYSGSARYRTRQRGWYIRSDETVAIGEHGEYYLMAVWAGLRERFVGVDVTASAPPLVVGKGGRDGESFDLDVLLAACLDRLRGAHH